MRRLRLCLLLAFLIPRLTSGAERSPPAGLEFVQRLDAPLPLELGLRDETGREVRLGDYFGRGPVILVLGYFNCRNLCGTLLDGVLESLAQAGLPASAYRFLAVSIDPRDDSAAAGAKAAAYRPILAGGDIHFLTGEAGATARLAGSAGFPYAWDGEQGEFRHPAGFLVATPEGRIARYFLGVRFASRDLRLALVEASAGRVGSAADRLLLLCSHYDPDTGRYTFAAMTAVRAACLLAAVSLGVWLWRRTGGAA